MIRPASTAAILRAFAAVGVVGALGCGSEGKGKSAGPPPILTDPAAQPTSGVVGRVGPSAVHGLTVGRIVDAQGVSPREAFDRAAYDARLALAGLAKRSPQQNRREETRLLAHAMLMQLSRDAEQAPITPQELAGATAAHWLDVDRPVSYRAVHAVVQLDKKVKPDEALDLAKRIHAATTAAAATAAETTTPKRSDESQLTTDGKDDPAQIAFVTAAKAVPKGKASVRVEGLQTITAEGRIVARGVPAGAVYDPVFAKALAKLGKRGTLSEVVTTKFGHHVILLLDVFPPKRVPRERRLELLTFAVHQARTRRAERELLKALRSQNEVLLPRNIHEILAVVKVAR